ncbi:MAG: hypothetical protein HY508_03505 [Acidobacteria bacterium]|nr:hypothetical protein [Acidobacteriota bacterium]
MRIRIVLMLAVIFVLNSSRGAMFAQQPKPSPEPPRFPKPPAAARIWKSLTTGKEYQVWLANDRLFAEWVNIPPRMVSMGASIRIECQRINGKWLGTSQNHLPCDTTENGKRVTNFCRLTSKIEFNPLEANRMTGRTEWVRRFDCANCTILEPVWTNFEWVPKEPSAMGNSK